MKAAFLNENGEPSVLIYGDLEKPIPSAGEVVVKLKYAALNYVDVWVRKGSPAYKVPLPHVPGADGAGVVELVGAEVEGISSGDRVLIIPGIVNHADEFAQKGLENQSEGYEILGTKRWGTYGEYVKVPDQNIMLLPEDFPFDKAAAFPLAYLTAWHMLVTRARLTKGETVLILGAGGGVSTGALQIANFLGAHVLAVTRHDAKAASLKSLGAQEVLVSPDSHFADLVKEKTAGRGVDVVFEHVGPVTWGDSIQSLSRTGRLVTCGATTGPTVSLDLRTVFSRDLSILGAKMGTQREFAQLAQTVFSGKIVPLIDRVFPLSEAAQAHSHIESSKHFGKILLQHPN